MSLRLKVRVVNVYFYNFNAFLVLSLFLRKEQ
ncbi:MAG: hypothetical protein ACJAWS_001420 [Oleiphilaceae bacterium]|jgi:hypothetical protein